MQTILNMIENSRLTEIIGQVERGERVDLKRALALQALDIARAGELFALDVLREETKADEQLQRLGN